MSTFFKSAAMSLLRRTLQALLYKYLSDVDVEGVALPSFSGNNDSGWGVRLSNVKLRDGAKLIDLPGKVRGRDGTSSKKRRKSRAMHKNENGDNLSQKSEARVTSGSCVACSHQKPQSEQHATALDERECRQDQSKPTELNYVADDESIRRGGETDDVPGQHQPKRSTSWLASWFYRDSTEELDASEIDEGKTLAIERDGGALNVGTYNNKISDVSHQGDYCNVYNDQVILPNPDEFHASLTENNSHASSGRDKNCDDIENESNNSILEHTAATIGSQNNVNEDEWANENENDEYKDDDDSKMILRLGQGCTIGTLDVRLVGKTIHVLVEDAFLTVEAIRQAPESLDGPATSAVDKGGANAKPSKNTSETSTVGDRVLAENAIARIFSMIPNLLLRDIQIRVVIRGESEISQPATNSTSTKLNNSLDYTCDVEGETTFEYGTNDSVIEFGVELLSVTDGDDFLSKFRSTVDSDDRESRSELDIDYEPDTVDNKSADAASKFSHLSSSTNEFLIKRIRTGRGVEGGIVVRIFPAGVEHVYNPNFANSRANTDRWARQSWISESQFVVLRCSGLDLKVRILMDTKVENSDDSDEEFYYDYDDVTLDSMLFGGVDYVAPGPQPPLPPISNTAAEMKNGIGMTDSETVWGISPSSTLYVIDTNGIQSCGVRSSFHNVARGLVPLGHNCSNLPCEYEAVKWEKVSGVDHGNLLDASSPLAGLVCHLSLRDMLEINVDRQSLETIGFLISLFSRQNKSNSELNNDTDVRLSLRRENSRSGTDDCDILSDMSSGSANPTHESSQWKRLNSSRMMDLPSSLGQRNRKLQEDVPLNPPNTDSGFAEYMQPEKICFIGIHVAELRLRVHYMKQNEALEDVASFCYWSIIGKCLTLDQQQLTASERPFLDLRVDLGHLKVIEYKGVDRKQLACVGIQHPPVAADELTVETYLSEDMDSQRSPWPSTAAAMLSLSPPLETLVYERRDRHAIQVRFVTVLDPGEVKNRMRKQLIVHLGPAYVDAPFAVRHDFIKIVREAKAAVFGRPNEDQLCANNVSPTKNDSIMRYSVRIEGGRYNLHPFVAVTLPRTDVHGETSHRLGFSFEAMLDKVGVQFGQATPHQILDRGLTLTQLAALPEIVRLRILIFLKELEPLETALGIKTESNPFLRYQSVNKGILKMSKKMMIRSTTTASTWASSLSSSPTSSSSQSTQQPKTDRRQALMAELLKMDDDSLESLLVIHQRRSRTNCKIKLHSG